MKQRGGELRTIGRDFSLDGDDQRALEVLDEGGGQRTRKRREEMEGREICLGQRVDLRPRKRMKSQLSFL